MTRNSFREYGFVMLPIFIVVALGIVVGAVYLKSNNDQKSLEVTLDQINITATENPQEEIPTETQTPIPTKPIATATKKPTATHTPTPTQTASTGSSNCSAYQTTGPTGAIKVKITSNTTYGFYRVYIYAHTGCKVITTALDTDNNTVKGNPAELTWGQLAPGPYSFKIEYFNNNGLAGSTGLLNSDAISGQTNTLNVDVP